MECDLSVKLAQEMSKKHFGASILITVSHIQKNTHTNIRFGSNISAQEFSNVKKSNKKQMVQK